MSSAQNDILSAVVATLQTVPGLAAVDVVPIDLQFREVRQPAVSPDGISYEKVVVVPTLPSAYDGAVVSLNEYAARISVPVQNNNSAQAIIETPVFIAFYALGDQQVAGDAQRKVWALKQAAMKKLLLLSPESSDPDVRIWPLRPYEDEPILVDATTHGLLSKLWAKHALAVNA